MTKPSSIWVWIEIDQHQLFYIQLSLWDFCSANSGIVLFSCLKESFIACTGSLSTGYLDFAINHVLDLSNNFF